MASATQSDEPARSDASWTRHSRLYQKWLTKVLLLDLVPVAHPANALFDLFGFVFIEVIARDALKPLLHDVFARLGRRLSTIAAALFA